MNYLQSPWGCYRIGQESGQTGAITPPPFVYIQNSGVVTPPPPGSHGVAAVFEVHYHIRRNNAQSAAVKFKEGHVGGGLPN